MSDLPYPSRFHPPTITSFGRETALGTLNIGPLGARGGPTASTSWPTNNLALYIPFTIWAPYLVKSVFWANGATVSGNVDCGVYSVDTAALLFNATSTAQSGTSAPQVVAVGPILLNPGTYYMALVSSTTAAKFYCSTAAAFATIALQASGCAQAANGSLPLASSFTPATPSSFSSILPLFGISSRVSTLI